MGNCLVTNNKVISEGEDGPYISNEAMKSNGASPSPTPSSSSVVRRSMEKKRVSFRLYEDGEDEVDGEKQDSGDGNSSSAKNGVVRIKVVVSQEELRQILNFRKDYSQFSSVEQFLRALKLRNRSITTKVKTRNTGSNVDEIWKPALESIPEEH